MSTLRTKGLGMGQQTAQVYERYLAVRKTVALEQAAEAALPERDPASVGSTITHKTLDIMERVRAQPARIAADSAARAETLSAERQAAAATEKVVERMLQATQSHADAAEDLERSRSTYMLCLEELQRQADADGAPERSRTVRGDTVTYVTSSDRETKVAAVARSERVSVFLLHTPATTPPRGEGGALCEARHSAHGQSRIRAVFWKVTQLVNLCAHS
jgi:hypothetical protein